MHWLSCNCDSFGLGIVNTCSSHDTICAIEAYHSVVEIECTKTLLSQCLLAPLWWNPWKRFPGGLEIVPISKALVHQHVAFTSTLALLALYQTLRNDAKVCRMNIHNLKLHLITHRQPTTHRYGHNGYRARPPAIPTHEWLEATTIRGLGTGEQAPSRKSR